MSNKVNTQTEEVLAPLTFASQYTPAKPRPNYIPADQLTAMYRPEPSKGVYIDGIALSWGDAFSIAFKFYIALTVISAPVAIALFFILRSA